MHRSWARRASLSTRVVMAASASVMVVVLAYSFLLRETLHAAISGWELERLGAVAHHVAQMVSREADADHRETIAAVAEDHRIFGYEIEWAATGQPGPETSAVTVGLEGASGVVRVSATAPLFETLDRRLWIGCGLLGVGAIIGLVAAVHGSVHWGLVRPLKAVRNQMRRIRRGPWAVPAAALGTREIADLAAELESVGHTLDRRITMWVRAERRAAHENARIELRQRLVEPVRDINLIVSDLLARKAVTGLEARTARRLVQAAARLRELVNDDEYQEAKTQFGEPEAKEIES